jgi:HPt (histidine-containing phosphotransfer) domain-containing protein
MIRGPGDADCPLAGRALVREAAGRRPPAVPQNGPMADHSQLSPERLAPLVALFVELARERRARVAALRHGLAKEALSADSIGEFETICHALHGSAGMFGFPEIGAAAEEAERLCEAVRRRDAQVAHLADALDRLCALIDRLDLGVSSTVSS